MFPLKASGLAYGGGGVGFNNGFGSYITFVKIYPLTAYSVK